MQTSKYTEHIILSFALITLAQLGYAFQSGVFSGQLADPDCYTWLVRAAQFHETRLWFDATLYRVDPPFGLEQHYTRPLEVLLLAGAWLIMPFAGFEKALYIWGALLSPILHIAAVLFLVWAFSSVYNNRRLIFLALGFIVQPAIFAAFMAGRPDHHSLSTLFFIISLGLLVRLMQDPAQKLWAWSAGFISALAFWVNVVNGVFIVLPILVFLNALWFLKEKDIGTAFFHYSASLLVFSAAALFIQNGWGEFYRPEVDRISIVFILFFFLVTLYAFFIQKKYNLLDKIHHRVLFSGVAGIGVIGLMYAVFPQLFSGIEIDPLYREIRTANIAHHTPIFSLVWPDGIISFIYWIGIILPTAVWFVHSLITKKWWKGLISDSRKSIYIKLSIFSIIIIVFYAQNALTVRYIHYVEIVCLLGYVVMMDNMVRRIEFRFDKSKALYLARPLAMFMMLTWFYYPMVFLEKRDSNGFDADILPVVKYVSSLDQVKENPMNIMAAPELGPYILYHTDHNVFSITNHRVRQGFTDWYHIMAAGEEEEALSIVNDRDVDMILISRPLDGNYFRNVEENALVHRLMAGEEIQWLKWVEVPKGIPQDILIFMVQRRSDFYEAHHSDTLLQ